MIPPGPTTGALPVRPGADLQQGQNAQPSPTPPSGTSGDERSAAKAETAQMVDPARQTADARSLRENESNEEARLVEPSRLAAQTLAATAAPDAETPAGPPPSFDWTMLEKARALAESGPPPQLSSTANPQTPASDTADAPSQDVGRTENDRAPADRRDASIREQSLPSTPNPTEDTSMPRVETLPLAASPPPQPGSVPPGVDP